MGLLVIAEPVWMYTGLQATIGHFFPFRIHYVTDIRLQEGQHTQIFSDFGFDLANTSITTQILGLAFSLSLILLWLPIVPRILGSKNIRDTLIGLLSVSMFMLLIFSALEDGKSFGVATNFDEQVAKFDLRGPSGNPWTFEEYLSYAGVQADSDYQFYMACNLTFFALIGAVFMVSLFGMLLSSSIWTSRTNQQTENRRELRNVNLVLIILYATSAVTAFIAIIPFTRNVDVLPGLPMFGLLLLMSGASFVDWKRINSMEDETEDLSLGNWILIIIIAQILFIFLSLFFAENYLAR